MKTLHLITILTVASFLSCNAEDKKLPDLSKAFPAEKLFSQSKLGGMETYSWATDLAYVDLEKKFLKYVGPGWVQQKTDKENQARIDKSMKDQGVVLEGNKIFANPAYPGIKLGLTQMKMAIEGKMFLAQVLVIKE